MAPIANPTVAPLAANTDAQAATIKMARAAREKMTPRKVIDPYPKSILGKRNALHAFGCSENPLEPPSKKPRNDEGDSCHFLLRHAEAEMVRMQQEHTTRLTGLQISLQETRQEVSMHISTVQTHQKDLQHERENATQLRGELSRMEQDHTVTVTGLQNSLQETRQEVMTHVSTVRKLEKSLQHEQDNSTGLRSNLNVAESRLSQMHAQLTLEQNHLIDLQNELEKANQSLAAEREINVRKSQENATLVKQIQTQPDRDMDDANFHGQPITPENSELEIMDESEDSIQPQGEHSSGTAQTDSEEILKLRNEVAKLRGELQQEVEKRKSAEDNEQIYRGLFDMSQASLRSTQQSPYPANSENNGDLKASDEGPSTAQADAAPSEMMESDIESEHDHVSGPKPLSRMETLSRPKNVMNTRSTKNDKSKASISKTKVGMGVKKPNKPVKKLGKEAAEQAARKLVLQEMKVEKKLIQDFRKVLENHIELPDDLYSEARADLARGKSSEEVDRDIRISLDERFEEANVYYDNGVDHMLSWQTLYPNGTYSEFRYYTKKGPQSICIELLDNDLNYAGQYPILPSYKPYFEMDMVNKAHYAQNLIFAKFPEVQLAAAKKVLPAHLVTEFRKLLFEGEPVEETWEEVHCKGRWDDVVSTLSSMQSFRRACGYYAQGEKIDPKYPFWPLNFAKPAIMSACDPKYDELPGMPSNVEALESLFTQTFIR